MNSLISELHQDHQTLAKALEAISHIGVTSKEGQDTLAKIKSGLLNHLKKEDEKLYPALRKAAEKDEKLKRLLEVFAKNMEEITTEAINFFNKYEKGGSNFEFAKDFGKLAALLSSRIRKEEGTLYPEFEKLGH